MNQKLIYVMYFWKYSTKELLEDILELSIDEISEYMVEMGKYFYEKEISKFDKSVFLKGLEYLR